MHSAIWKVSFKKKVLITNEEMPNTMEFIVEQQAQKFAKIDALAEAQGAANDRWTRTERELVRCLPSPKSMSETSRLGRGHAEHR